MTHLKLSDNWQLVCGQAWMGLCGQEVAYPVAAHTKQLAKGDTTHTIFEWDISCPLVCIIKELLNPKWVF